MELALRELGFALILSGAGEEYPKNELDRIWKEVLLYQFHDIIPGSSIKRVYDESCARYEILLDRVVKMTDGCYKKAAQGSGLTVFNSLSWPRSEIVCSNGKYYRIEVPAMGYASLPDEHAADFSVSASENGKSLENNNLKVVFDTDGSVVSVYDKAAGREVLSGKSNVYSLYCDESADCWDIPIEYTDRAPEKFILKKQEFYISGPDAVCEQEYLYGSSFLHVKAVLTDGKKRVDFRVHADWHENCKMLRTAFDTNILTDHASFEIQYGKIERRNNNNTTWENARFEVCGHKWADVSEKDYGVALLNNCKYGHRVIGGVLDLNLLRSQNHPGENADRGEHDFTYSLYPHSGDESRGEVSKEAYELNIPLTVIDCGGSGKNTRSMFAVEGKAVLETVKKAEKSGETVLRLFEPYGSTVEAALHTEGGFSRAVSCDLMENEEKELSFSGDLLKLHFKPFEIKTLKLFK